MNARARRSLPAVRPLAGPACHVLLAALALAVGLHKRDASGPTYPDAPRYANAGAMIHDWFLSGQWTRPYRFALANYRQYPGFSLPYHPPAYPALLGLVFVVTGVSEGAVRGFVAGCLAGSTGLFFSILRRNGAPHPAALAVAALLPLSWEFARWSRDAMSEIPSLCFVLVGTRLFLAWLDAGRPKSCWLAFAAGEVAFLSRMLTAGVLPAWFLYALLGRARHRLRSAHPWLAAGVFLAVSLGWVAFAKQFSRYELSASGLPTEASPIRVPRLSWENLTYFPARSPEMVGWGGVALALAGAALGLAGVVSGRLGQQARFWAAWLLCSVGFQWLLALTEQRYYLYAAVGLLGLGANLLQPPAPRWVRLGLGPALLAAALTLDLHRLPRLPTGVVGYGPVSEMLAGQEGPGNVLLATWHDQELIFRYRAAAPTSTRELIRSDRSLAIRVSPTVGVPGVLSADNPAAVLEVIRKAHARYLVTCASGADEVDDREPEVILAHTTATTRPDLFAPIGRSPLRIDFGGLQVLQGWVYVWEYRGELPAGPSEIPVRVPTARLEIGPTP